MFKKLLQRNTNDGYTVVVSSAKTSQEAVKKTGRSRFARKIAKPMNLIMVTLIAAMGLGVFTAGSLTTSSHAEANLIADLVCITKPETEGSWNEGANKYFYYGGAPVSPSVREITKGTVVSGAAVNGEAYPNWAEAKSTEPGSKNAWKRSLKTITAYEKYGTAFPAFQAWKPAFTEDATFPYKGIPVGTDNATMTNLMANDAAPLGTETSIDSASNGLVTNDVGACVASSGVTNAAIAQLMTMPGRMFVTVSNWIYEQSTLSLMAPDSFLGDIAKTVDEVITKQGGLRDNLFIPFIVPLTLIGTVWVAYRGIVQRAANAAMQSVLWMVVAVAAGTFFLAKPTLIPSFVDRGVQEVNGLVNSAIVASNTDALCDTGGSSAHDITREVQCAIWKATIYDPWVVGQFGGAGMGDNLVTKYLVNSDNDPRGYLATKNIEFGTDKVVGASDHGWPLMMTDLQATTQTVEMTEVAYAQLAGDPGNSGRPSIVNVNWGQGVHFISGAFFMLWGSISTSIVMAVFGFFLLGYQLMMVSSMLFSPVFFALGIIPNWGRRVLMRYAEIIVGLFLKRVLTNMMFMVYLLLFTLSSTTLDLPLIGLLFYTTLIGIFALIARGQFVGMFANSINFGGNKSVDVTATRAASEAGAVLAGGAMGAMIGPAVGMLSGRNKDKESGRAKSDASSESSSTVNTADPTAGAGGAGPVPNDPTDGGPDDGADGAGPVPNDPDGDGPDGTDPEGDGGESGPDGAGPTPNDPEGAERANPRPNGTDPEGDNADPDGSGAGPTPDGADGQPSDGAGPRTSNGSYSEPNADDASSSNEDASDNRVEAPNSKPSDTSLPSSRPTFGETARNSAAGAFLGAQAGRRVSDDLQDVEDGKKAAPDVPSLPKRPRPGSNPFAPTDPNNLRRRNDEDRQY